MLIVRLKTKWKKSWLFFVITTEKVDKAEKIEDEDNITAKDLGDIEKAIEDQAKHYKDELAEVAEDLDEYKEVSNLEMSLIHSKAYWRYFDILDNKYRQQLSVRHGQQLLYMFFVNLIIRRH
jgi:beta-N-acetylglucosaminidase